LAAREYCSGNGPQTSLLFGVLTVTFPLRVTVTAGPFASISSVFHLPPALWASGTGTEPKPTLAPSAATGDNTGAGQSRVISVGIPPPAPP
jgi:hypothetical protein